MSMMGDENGLKRYPFGPVSLNLEADPRIYNSYGMGRSQEIWGKDAHHFRPERWSGLEAHLIAVSCL